MQIGIYEAFVTIRQPDKTVTLKYAIIAESNESALEKLKARLSGDFRCLSGELTWGYPRMMGDILSLNDYSAP